MKRWLLMALAVALTACSGGTSDDSQTVTEYCVEQVEALYKRHDLPFTSEPAERPAICEKWMADRGVTTKAEIATAVKVADKQYREMEK